MLEYLPLGIYAIVDSGPAWVQRELACLHKILQIRIFQDPGLPGTVKKTVPADLGPVQIN